MGQIPQDGNNGQNVAFFYFFIATVTKRFERKYFWNLPGKISSEQLRKVENIKPKIKENVQAQAVCSLCCRHLFVSRALACLASCSTRSISKGGNFIPHSFQKQRKYTKQGNAHAHQLTLEERGLERKEAQPYSLSVNPPS